MVDEPSDFEKQKWHDEFFLKQRELDIKEKESKRARWSNPIALAILAATIAAIGNAWVALTNGQIQKEIEENKASEARTLARNKLDADLVISAIKTDKEELVATNLQFLIDADLLADYKIKSNVRGYLKERKERLEPKPPLAHAELGPLVDDTPFNQQWCILQSMQGMPPCRIRPKFDIFGKPTKSPPETNE